MKPTRIAALLMLAFLFGGSSAEVAVQTKRAIDRARQPEPGSTGELVALDIHRQDGQVIARPRLIARPGVPALLTLHDPERPGVVRLSLRVETTRDPSGDLRLDYDLSLPGEDLQCSGRLSVTPGVEQALDLGDRPLVATLLALPVPSADFDAFLESEAAARRTVVRPI